MKKPKQQKKLLDDIDELPEESESDLEDALPYPEEEEEESDTTEEITEDDFYRFKETQPSDWE